MKIITPGHRYELENFEQTHSVFNQFIQFIEKRQENGVFVTVNNGTTNEEVLAMMIDRLQSLNAKIPNDFTTKATEHCRLALEQLEARTAERKARNVEGTPNK